MLWYANNSVVVML